MNRQFSSFIEFVRSHGVVGLAVGLAIGTQVGKAVEAIVEGVINPFVTFIVGSKDGLERAAWNVAGPDSPQTDYWFSLGDRQLIIKWGSTLSALIVLAAVVAVIYYLVMGLRLDKLDKPKDKN